MLTEFLVGCGLVQSSHDPCLFTARDARGRVAVVVIYVDDLVISGDWMELRAEVKKSLSERFCMKDVSSGNQLLGMVCEHDQAGGVLKLHQKPLVQKLLDTYGEGDMNIYSTPAETDTYKQLENFVHDKKEIVKSDWDYRGAVATMLYLSVMTRPDIANIVRYLSRFLNCYHSLHVKFAKRVMGYLRGTMDVGIVFRRNGDCTLKAFSDSSYGDDYFTGRSTNAHIVLLDNGPVCWRSSMMNFVVMSSTHSEFGAMSDAVTAVGHVANLRKSILGGHESPVEIRNKDVDAIDEVSSACEADGPDGPVPLLIDNMAAIHIGSNDRGSKRAKHINARFMNVREAVLNGLVKLVWVSTTEQVADILTKCLGAPTFLKLRRMFMSA